MSEKMGWEEEFDKKIGMTLCYLGSGGEKHLKKIKDFIRSTIAEATKRARLEEREKVIDELLKLPSVIKFTDNLDESPDFWRGLEMLRAIFIGNVEALKSSLEENKESDAPVIGKRWDKVHFID